MAPPGTERASSVRRLSYAALQLPSLFPLQADGGCHDECEGYFVITGNIISPYIHIIVTSCHDVG